MITTTLKKGLPLLWLGLSLGYNSPLWAHGEVISNGGTKEFYITLTGDELINNTAGSQTGKEDFTWDLGEGGGSYWGKIQCNRLIEREQHYYTSFTQLPPSEYGRGFLKLNDYLDVKIDTYIGGNRKTYVTVPFQKTPNLSIEDNTKCQPERPGEIGTVEREYHSGSKGQVIFRVRKPIINGVNLQQREIIELYGYYGIAGNIGTEPMARVIIESAIVAVPDKCTINNGDLIDIEFGTLPDDQLDGHRFKQPLALNFRCEGGSFSPGSDIKINMAVSGHPASFSSTLLKTDRDNLAITIKENDKDIELNKFYQVQSTNNTGLWSLNVAPISKGGTTAPEGEFNAAATIVAQFD